MESLQLSAEDGKPIRVYRWLPPHAPEGLVLISHGLTEHGARYAYFARDLCQAGFAVYAYDHRGHGAHAEQTGWFAESDGWRLLQSDLEQVRSGIAAWHPDTPLCLFGHSMGSFIARRYFIEHGARLDALVLSATGYRQGKAARVMQLLTRLWGKVVGPRQPSRFLTRLIFGGFSLAFRPRRTPLDWLSSDPSEVDRYLADPLCGFFPTPSLWSDLFGGVAEMEKREKLARKLEFDCPVLLVAGSRDPVSLGGYGLKQLARRYHRAGLTQIALRIYPGGRHEMHNEVNRAEVMTDLIRWLKTHLAPHPPARH
jgi:alpha-beta hydrolase superfamily lysophospholipase